MTVVEKVKLLFCEIEFLIDSYKFPAGQTFFRQIFGVFRQIFDPYRVHVEVEWGQIYKMLKMPFHVYQISHQVLRITQIYSRFMSDLWLLRYQKVIERLSRVKFSTMSDFHD